MPFALASSRQFLMVCSKISSSLEILLMDSCGLNTFSTCFTNISGKTVNPNAEQRKNKPTGATMIGVEQALDCILENVHPTELEEISIFEALGRVLSFSVEAQQSLPLFNKAAMDGYAVNSRETASASADAPMNLPLRGVIRAGMPLEKTWETGTAYKIMTGAPVPEKADAVIQWESVEEHPDFVRIFAPVPAKKNIIGKGEQVRRGDCVLSAGCLLAAVQIGVLASLGIHKVSVYKKPTVAIISTGDELADSETASESGKIFDTNTALLSALLQEQHADVRSVKRVPDDYCKTVEAFRTAFAQADIVITSGGVSKGDYDFVPAALRAISATILFDSVAIKPGKPMVFALWKEKCCFCLPGNPLSVVHMFEELVKPALDKMRGLGRFLDETVKMILEEDFKNNGDRRRYIYGVARSENGQYYFRNAGNQSSNQLFTRNRSNSVIWLPAQSGRHVRGEQVWGRLL